MNLHLPVNKRVSFSYILLRNTHIEDGYFGDLRAYNFTNAMACTTARNPVTEEFQREKPEALH